MYRLLRLTPLVLVTQCLLTPLAWAQMTPPPLPPGTQTAIPHIANPDDPKEGWSYKAAIARIDFDHIRNPAGQMPIPPENPYAKFGPRLPSPGHPLD